MTAFLVVALNRSIVKRLCVRVILESRMIKAFGVLCRAGAGTLCDFIQIKKSQRAEKFSVLVQRYLRGASSLALCRCERVL